MDNRIGLPPGQRHNIDRGGQEIMGVHDEETDADDEAIPFVRLVVAANDHEHVLWPPENVKFAAEILKKTRGHIPAIEDLTAALGSARFESLMAIIIPKRQFDNACLGYLSPCHSCGTADDLSRFDFALMRVEQSNRQWGMTAASLALSAALFPVLGSGVVKLPGKSFHGATIHLRLVLCRSCQAAERGFFGTFLINETKAAKHPLWEELKGAGFNKFLVRDTLPAELKYAAHKRL